MPPANSNTSSLRQGTLSFASSKRTTSTTNGKLQPPKGKSISSVERRRKADQEDVKALDLSAEINEDESSAKVSKTLRHRTDSGANTKGIRKSTSSTSASSNEIPDESEKNLTPSVDIPRPELDVNDAKWTRHHAEVRKKMGKVNPIHAQGKNKIHEILRVFDLNYDYGPCVGVTRLERWERAELLGLNPPTEVRDILTTRQGADQVEYSQCVFYEEV